jgi:AraC-like DNA-binding protein
MNEQDYNNFRITVPSEYKNYFSHFYFAENNTEDTLTKTLLPTFQTMLIFCFGANASLTTRQNTTIEVEKCLAFGPIKQAFDYSLPINTKILIANFKGDAFYRFFGNSSLPDNLPTNPNEFFEENCFTNLWYELIKIDSAAEQVNRILEFCKPYLRRQNDTARLLTEYESGTLNPIKSIAGATNQTERNIQLHQKKHFGYSVKEINRYKRFIKAVELIQNIAEDSKKLDWFEIVTECNYYDQSQLVHDFKHFIHLSPTQFLKFQQDICGSKTE